MQRIVVIQSERLNGRVYMPRKPGQPAQLEQTMRGFLRALCAFLLVVTMASATQASEVPPLPDSERPKLVVVIVIDQFRAEYLSRFALFFGEGGFKRLMRNGANLTNARYSYATTYTGPGHALILLRPH